MTKIVSAAQVSAIAARAAAVQKFRDMSNNEQDALFKRFSSRAKFWDIYAFCASANAIQEAIEAWEAAGCPVLYVVPEHLKRDPNAP